MAEITEMLHTNRLQVRATGENDGTVVLTTRKGKTYTFEWPLLDQVWMNYNGNITLIWRNYWLPNKRWENSHSEEWAKALDLTKDKSKGKQFTIAVTGEFKRFSPHWNEQREPVVATSEPIEWQVMAESEDGKDFADQIIYFLTLAPAVLIGDKPAKINQTQDDWSAIQSELARPRALTAATIAMKLRISVGRIRKALTWASENNFAEVVPSEEKDVNEEPARAYWRLL